MPRFSPFYRAYMQSAAWYGFRQQVLRRDQYCCVRCGSRQRLEVDHLTYVRLGHERVSDCQTLCHACHGRQTRADRRRRGARWGVRLVGWLLLGVALLSLLSCVGRFS